MTDAEYIDILRVHGRRVANRAVLSATPLNQRLLTDFYDCHAPERDLPEAERGRTPLLNTFDPSGWNALYSDKAHEPWPEPEGALAPSRIDVVDIDAATKEAILRAAIVEAGRAVSAAVANLKTDEDQTRRGTELIEQHTARLAAAFGITDQQAKLYNAIVEEVNATLIQKEDA